jgi:hypothetical protein
MQGQLVINLTHPLQFYLVAGTSAMQEQWYLQDGQKEEIMTSNQKVRQWSAAIGAVALALGIGAVISGAAAQADGWGGWTYPCASSTTTKTTSETSSTNPTPTTKKKGNNGWGNGGDDGINNGSNFGNGVSPGGNGRSLGGPQSETKFSDANR